MNPTCTEIERRVIGGLPLTDALREHATRCDRCDLTLSLPSRIADGRASRHVTPGPGFATRSFAAAVDRIPRRRARRRRAAAGGLVAATAAAAALVLWQQRRDIDIAAVDAPVETSDRLPGQAPPAEVDLGLGLDLGLEGIDWRRVAAVLKRSPNPSGLSKVQLAGIREVVDTANRDAIGIEADLKRLALELRRELQRTPPSLRAVNKLLDRIGRSERDLRRTRIGAWVTVHNIAAGVSDAPGPPAPPARPSPPSRPSRPAKPGRRCDEVTCLVDPLASCCPAAPSAPTPPSPPASPERPTKTDIRAGMSRVSGAVKACGKRAGFAGKIRARIRVSSRGRVASVRVSGGPDAVNSCVSRAIQQARFSESEKGISLTYGYAL